jgi:hypothetical protein
VEAEFRDRFADADAGNLSFFIAAGRTGHFQFDLPGYCRLRLRRAGVATVAVSEKCTYADAASFFSYRRATHLGEPDYGRQISAITLGPAGFGVGRPGDQVRDS